MAPARARVADNARVRAEQRRVPDLPDARLHLALPRRAHVDGRPRALDRGRSHLRPRGTKASLSRDLVRDPPVRVPRGRALLRPSTRGRHRLQRRSHGAGVVGRVVRRGVRVDPRLARWPAAAFQRASLAPSTQRHSRGTGRRVDLLERTRGSTGSKRNPGSSSSGGSSPATAGGRRTRSPSPRRRRSAACESR